MASRKLYSPTGTYLGVVTYPDHLERYLREHGNAQFHGDKPPSADELIAMLTSRAPVAATERKIGRLAFRHDYEGGVTLHGVSIEEFEELPGFAFAPSMTYIRSLIGKD